MSLMLIFVDINSSRIGHDVDNISSRIGRVFSPLGGQLPPPLVVLANEARTHKELFRDLADSPWRQSQQRGDDIQPHRALGKDGRYFLSVGPRPMPSICFKFTGKLKMVLRDGLFALAAAYAMA